MNSSSQKWERCHLLNWASPKSSWKLSSAPGRIDSSVRVKDFFAGSRHIAYWVNIEYWVQHFPQHHLSGSGIAQLESYHCREPAWGTPPMTKVMRKEARHTQRRDRASGVPLEILEHLPPKPESAYFLLCALTYTSDFMGGGCPPLPLSEKRVNL